MKSVMGKIYEGRLRSLALIQPREEETEWRAHGDLQLTHKREMEGGTLISTLLGTNSKILILLKGIE